MDNIYQTGSSQGHSQLGVTPTADTSFVFLEGLTAITISTYSWILGPLFLAVIYSHSPQKATEAALFSLCIYLHQPTTSSSLLPLISRCLLLSEAAVLVSSLTSYQGLCPAIPPLQFLPPFFPLVIASIPETWFGVLNFDQTLFSSRHIAIYLLFLYSNSSKTSLSAVLTPSLAQLCCSSLDFNCILSPPRQSFSSHTLHGSTSQRCFSAQHFLNLSTTFSLFWGHTHEKFLFFF